MGNKKEDYIQEFIEILQEKGNPLYNPDFHSAIFERIKNGKSKINELKTPDSTRTTVDYYLRTCAKEKKGIYRLKDNRFALIIWKNQSIVAENKSFIQEVKDQSETPEHKLIMAFGREWKRKIFELNGTSIAGVLANDKSKIRAYFDNCSGIYLLQKGRKIVYVGQAACIRERLSQHLTDDKCDTWDTFSWFALYDKDTKNKKIVEYKTKDVIDSLEAILIDVLEPYWNLKRGNNHKQKEYEQVETGLDVIE